MNPNTKKNIKGFAKTAGKYTLKGLGKGIELTGRGAIKTVNALVKSPGIQRLATAAGLLAAGLAIPTIGMGLIGLIALKYMADQSSGKHKSIFDEMNDIVFASSMITKGVSDAILSPTLKRNG